VSQEVKTIYLTWKEFNTIADKLETLADMIGVKLHELYGRDPNINSTNISQYVLKLSDEVESVLFVPTDAASPATPPAFLNAEVDIPNVVEYIERKISENKVIPICDSYECDYIVFK